MKKLRTSEQADVQESTVDFLFRKTMTFVPVYYLIVWIPLSVLYFSGYSGNSVFWEALTIGVLWFVLTILFEYFAWVVAKHKYTLKPETLMKRSQPWVSLSWYAVLISPIIIAFALA